MCIFFYIYPLPEIKINITLGLKQKIEHLIQKPFQPVVGRHLYLYHWFDKSMPLIFAFQFSAIPIPMLFSLSFMLIFFFKVMSPGPFFELLAIKTLNIAVFFSKGQVKSKS